MKGKQKKVPSNIKELLTPVALAHWIQGDGNYAGGGLALSVYSFSDSDVQLLVDALTNNFSIKCTIRKDQKGPTIYITLASMDIIRPILKPLMVSTMHYKLGIK